MDRVEPTLLSTGPVDILMHTSSAQIDLLVRTGILNFALLHKD